MLIHHSISDHTETDTRATIFVIGDDNPICGALRMMMESTGIDCRVFKSIQPFFQSYEPHRPGCLILDIDAIGIDGLELLESMRARQIPLPVIILTGDGDIPTAVRAMKAGALDFVQKPVSEQYLWKRIREALHENSRPPYTWSEHAASLP